MAAHEQRDQRVVGVRGGPVGGGCQPLVGQYPPGDGVLPALAGLLAAQQVGQPARGDRDQPGARVVRYAVLRPLQGSREERLLRRVLGGGEVPVAAYHRAENPRRQLAQQALDIGTGHGGGYASSSSKPSTIGRTSTYQSWLSVASAGCGVSASRAAISVARSKLSHSTIV